MELTKEQAQEELKVEKQETGWMRILRANLYESHMIYVRQLGRYRFEYLVEYNGEIYSAYIIIKPPNNSRRKLTEVEVAEAAALIYNGGMATLDYLLGKDPSQEAKETLELLEETKDSVKLKDEEEDAESL